MTLNTFHFAGRYFPSLIVCKLTIPVGHGAANVTLGIPRLREIVMTASEKPKTPSMNMRIRPGTPQDDIDTFCKRASRLTLAQVVESASVVEQLQANADSRRMQYTVILDLFPREEYEAEHDVEPAEILQSFAVKFPLMLKKEITAEMKRLDADLKSQISQLGKGKKAKGHDLEEPDAADEGGEEGAGGAKKRRDEDEESEVGDGDADDEKRARQKKELASYSDDDESEDEEIGEYGDEELEAELAEGEDDDSKPKPKPKSSSKSLRNQVQLVGNSFKLNFAQAGSFDFNETRCSFELEVSSLDSNLLSHLRLLSLLASLRQICPSYCWWESSSEHAAQQSFGRFLVSQTVSRSKRR